MGWLLLVPIQFIIESEERIYMLRVKSLGSVAIIFEENIFILQLRSFFISRNIPLISKGTKEKGIKKKSNRADEKEKMKKPEKKRNQRKWILRLLRIPFSFRVKKLIVNIDSGDYIFNAYMFPVFGLLNHYGPDWSWNVNFYGKNQVSMKLQTTLIRLIYVYLK